MVGTTTRRAPGRSGVEILEVSGADAERIAKEISPEKVTGGREVLELQPELQEVEKKMGTELVPPEARPAIKPFLTDEVAPLKEEVFRAVDKDASPEEVRQRVAKANEAVEEMHEELSGVEAAQRVGTPIIVTDAEVVSSPRPEKTHIVGETKVMPPETGQTAPGLGEILGERETALAAERVQAERPPTLEAPGVRPEDVRSEAENIIGGLSSATNPAEIAERASRLRDFMSRTGIKASDLERLGVKIPTARDGKPLISDDMLKEDEVTGSGETPQGEATTTRPVTPHVERVGAASAETDFTTSRASRIGTEKRVRAGYEGLQDRLVVEAQEEALREAEFNRLRRELSDKWGRIQSTVNLDTLKQQNPQIQAGLENIVENAGMDVIDESKVQALRTVTLIADVEQETLTEGKAGLNPAIKEEAGTVMSVQNSIQSELKTKGAEAMVDIPMVVAAAKVYEPVDEEELRKRVLKNLDLKETLVGPGKSTGDVLSAEEVERILGGRDVSGDEEG